MEKLSKSGGSGDQSHLEEVSMPFLYTSANYYYIPIQRKELKRKEKELKGN